MEAAFEACAAASDMFVSVFGGFEGFGGSFEGFWLSLVEVLRGSDDSGPGGANDARRRVGKGRREVVAPLRVVIGVAELRSSPSRGGDGVRDGRGEPKTRDSRSSESESLRARPGWDGVVGTWSRTERS